MVPAVLPLVPVGLVLVGFVLAGFVLVGFALGSLEGLDDFSIVPFTSTRWFRYFDQLLLLDPIRSRLLPVIEPVVPLVPVPEGWRDPLSHPAAQTTASARPAASGPSERPDPPEADAILPFRPTTRSRMAEFRAPAKRPGARQTAPKRPGSAQLPRRGPTVIPDTADLCGELPYKA